jgi:hypothetical protein
MPDSSFYRQQADRFDRVADQCSVPELVPYYRRLAEDYRQKAANGATGPEPRGQADEIKFPE